MVKSSPKEVINMPKIITCLILLLCLILPSYSATEIAVTGKGVVKVEADLSYINVAIEKTEKTASQAQQEAAGVMQDVLVALRNAGIPKDKIQTTSFRLDPKYKYDKGQRNLIGYTASNQIRVTLDDLSKVGKIIDTAISAGANRVSNVIFTVKDDAPHKKEALKKAVNNARAKARAIAAAAGLALKRIVRIQESGAQITTPKLGLRAMKAESGGEAETPIVPGKVEVRGNLTIIYECVK
jgi:uncharacterized protein YggE